MTVSLILSPEVGVHYSNSGLPRDLLARTENLAKNADQGSQTVTLPPNAFHLPSPFAPDFMKRYTSFLSRMDSLLADLSRAPMPGTPSSTNSAQASPVRGVTIVLTGSFWKYYRSPRSSSRFAFRGAAGDRSTHATLAYRQCLEEFFVRREFADPTPAAANRWKAAALDEVNRRWFYQQSEDVFRHRSAQLVRRKSAGVPMAEVELYTPEADPSQLYHQFLEMVSGESADFGRFSSLLDEVSARESVGGGGGSQKSPPFVHWTSIGGYRKLADAEKQFLILKSLLLLAGRGGGLLMDEREWFSLSPGFRTRAEAFARAASHGDFQLRSRALFLTPHLWNTGATGGSLTHAGSILWEELQGRVGPRARMTASIDGVLRERDANLLVVDPSCILTREAVQKLTAWAKSDRIVVLPRSPLYTEAARAELEHLISRGERIEIDLGLPYRLHSVGEGKIVVYDLPPGPVPRAAWETFVTAMLSLAEVQGYCRVSDDRVSVIPMKRKGGEIGLFLLNDTRKAVSVDILFPCKVEVSDLASAFSAGNAQTSETVPVAANRFSLEVPPCGVLPLGVRGLNAAVSAVRTEPAPIEDPSVAQGALPGFDPHEPSTHMDRVWN